MKDKQMGVKPNHLCQQIPARGSFVLLLLILFSTVFQSKAVCKITLGTAKTARGKDGLWPCPMGDVLGNSAFPVSEPMALVYGISKLFLIRINFLVVCTLQNSSQEGLTRRVYFILPKSTEFRLVLQLFACSRLAGRKQQKTSTLPLSSPA